MPKENNNMKKFNPLIEDLISHFSFEMLFSPNDETIKIDKNTIKTLYEILNKHLFNGILIPPPIELYQEFKGTNHIAGYKHSSILLQGYNTYTLITKPFRLPNGKMLLPPKILINPDILKKDNIYLAFFINVLAHEMIHQDDIENGTYLKRLYECKMSGKTFNGHEGYFKTLANSMNSKFNLNIEETSDSLDKSIDKSIKEIRKALLEEEWKKVKNLTENTNLSDEEKLRRSIENMKDTDDFYCKYLGNGAFETIVF